MSEDEAIRLVKLGLLYIGYVTRLCGDIIEKCLCDFICICLLVANFKCKIMSPTL